MDTPAAYRERQRQYAIEQLQGEIRGLEQAMFPEDNRRWNPAGCVIAVLDVVAFGVLLALLGRMIYRG